MQELESEIKNLIAEIIEKDPSEISPDAKFFEELEMDSMMALEILSGVKKRYKINIPEEKLAQLTSLNATIAVAKEYLANKKE